MVGKGDKELEAIEQDLMVKCADCTKRLETMDGQLANMIIPRTVVEMEELESRMKQAMKSAPPTR